MKEFRVLVIISVFLGAQTVAFGQEEAVSTKVVDVNGEVVTIEAGSVNGVVVGMVLKIVRRDEPVIHPLTHEVLGTPIVPVCTVVIGEVKANSATGRITRQYMRPVMGDRVQFRPSRQEERQISLPVRGESQDSNRSRKKERSQTPKQTPERSMEFSSEAERAQFLEALKATYDFAKLSQDIKAMKKLSQRIGMLERSLVEQRKQIDEVGKSLKDDIALVRDEVATLKDEITLLKTKFEDLTKTVQGTGISLKGKDTELIKPHPVDTEEGGEEPSPKGEYQTPTQERALSPEKPIVPTNPWYLHQMTWLIGIAGVAGSGVAIFLVRRFRRKEQTDAPPISPRKRRRVEFAPKVDGGGSAEQDVKGGGKEDGMV